MKVRTRVATIAAAISTALALAPAVASADTVTTHGPKQSTIYVTGMSLGTAVKGPTLKIRVPADAPQGVKDAAALQAIADYRRHQRERIGTTGTVTPNATDYKYGNCGVSMLEFRDAIGLYYTGYYDSRWVTDWPGTAYRVNIHVWDTSAFDPSEWDYPRTGNLNGSTIYQYDDYISVDESGAKYGAKMNRGEVYIPSKGKWCYSYGPKVDNITIS